jgi:serine/threonine protein kinase
MEVVRAVLDKLKDLSDCEEMTTIGIGGFGRVVKVRCAGKIYALKVVKTEMMAREDMKLLFFREVFTQILAAHPCIVPIVAWNVFLHGRLCFSILMDFYQDGTLAKRIPVLNGTQRSIIAYGIARGMRHLHSYFSITHRDLKPDNIFLDSSLRPLVADLGLAKVAESVQNSQVTGTWKYMAPELVTAFNEGNAFYGLKVDVYSYGMICYQLIEGPELKLPRDKCRGNSESQLVWGNSIRAGIRPATKKATPEQIAWLERLWNNTPPLRPSFVQICAEFERRQNLFEGTDQAKFDQYKQWVDEQEAKVTTSYRIVDEEASPPWSSDVNRKNPVDRRMAFDIISSALDGDHEAQKCAAVLYLTGTAVEQSFLLAAKFAQMTEDPLMAILSRVSKNVSEFQRGELFEANGKIREAAGAYKKAAEAGSYRALWRWGSLLVHNDTGYHVNEGLKFMEVAAEHGVADAAFELGKLYIEGFVVLQDDERGLRWLEKALEADHPDAALFLARYYHSQYDVQKARDYYELADKPVGPGPFVKDDREEPIGHREAHELAKALHIWS